MCTQIQSIDDSNQQRSPDIPYALRQSSSHTVLDVFLDFRICNVAKRDNPQLTVNHPRVSHLRLTVRRIPTSVSATDSSRVDSYMTSCAVSILPPTMRWVEFDCLLIGSQIAILKRVCERREIPAVWFAYRFSACSPSEEEKTRWRERERKEVGCLF